MAFEGFGSEIEVKFPLGTLDNQDRPAQRRQGYTLISEMTRRFEEALVFASELHRSQLRKTTKTPYIGHLLGVAAIVLEHGGSEEEAIAALLHDAVEDQGGESTRAEILHRFGESVTAIVDGCTEDRIDLSLTHRERKERHLGSIRRDSPSVAPILFT